MEQRFLPYEKKIVIKGVSMVLDEDAWNRNKRNYNLMDIQREAKVAKSARWTNADELKYPATSMS